MERFKATEAQKMRLFSLWAVIENGDLTQVESLTPEEVAVLYQVNHVTVLRWLDGGWLPTRATFRTLGGHRRIFRRYVEIALENSGMTDDLEGANRLIDQAIHDAREAMRASKVKAAA